MTPASVVCAEKDHRNKQFKGIPVIQKGLSVGELSVKNLSYNPGSILSIHRRIMVNRP